MTLHRKKPKSPSAVLALLFLLYFFQAPIYIKARKTEIRGYYNSSDEGINRTEVPGAGYLGFGSPNSRGFLRNDSVARVRRDNSPIGMPLGSKGKTETVGMTNNVPKSDTPDKNSNSKSENTDSDGPDSSDIPSRKDASPTVPSPHENDDMKAEPDNEPSSDQSPDNSSNHPLPGKNPQTRPQHENSDPSPSPPAKQPSLNFPPPPSDISGVQITIPEKNDTPPPAVEGSKPPEWITGLFKPSNTGNLPPMHENQSHTVDTGPPASTATDSKNDNQPDTEQKQKSFPSWLIPSNTSPDEDKNKKSNVKGDNADEEKDSKTNTIITSVAIFIAVAVAIGFISTTIRKTSVKRKRFQGRLADIDQPSINPTALFGSEPTPNYATYDESLPLPSKEYKTYTPNQHNYSQSTVYHHSDYSQNLSPHHQKVSTPQHAKYDYDDDRIFYSRDEHHP